MPAKNLYEAIQSYLLLWQVMCIEQAPNPFAFSVGNADRIFEPYRNDLSREQAASLFKHFLVFQCRRQVMGHITKCSSRRKIK